MTSSSAPLTELVGTNARSATTAHPAVAVADIARTVARHGRISWLDAAKGIGILLVVLGHCLGGLHDAGLLTDRSALWLLFYVIYSFHMPLFFFLSASLVAGRARASQPRFLRTMVTKIVYPFVLWSIIQSAVLLSAARVVNHPMAGGAAHDFLRILWAPPGQFWFLYALFFLHAAALIALRIGGTLVLGFALALVYLACALSPATATFVAGYMPLTCMLFYVLGVCFGNVVLGWRGELRRPYALIALGAIVCLAGAWTGWTNGAEFYAPAALPAAFAGTLVVIELARRKLLQNNAWLVHLGRQSMPIYVMHVLFVAGARIVLAKLLLVHSVAAILPVIFVAGVAGPLAVSAIARRLGLQQMLGLG